MLLLLFKKKMKKKQTEQAAGTFGETAMELEIFSPLHNDIFFYFSTPTRKRGCTDD